MNTLIGRITPPAKVSSSTYQLFDIICLLLFAMKGMKIEFERPPHAGLLSMYRQPFICLIKDIRF